MYEYKVIDVTFKNLEKEFNEYAKEGWRVIATAPNTIRGNSLLATLERKVS